MDYSIVMQFLLEFGFGIGIEYLVKTGVKQLPDNFKSRPNLRIPKPRRRISVPKANFINRTDEMQAVEDAIDKQDGTTRLLYFYGPGGIGKTRLMEQIRIEIEKKPQKSRPFWGGVYDLYHADLHDILELQGAIVNTLDPEHLFFLPYILLRQEFEIMRQQRQSEAHFSLENLDEKFVENLCEFARQQKRLVIAFDTVESLAYESELIQSICKIENMSAAVRVWLLEKLAKLENTVVVLAGRPDSKLKKDLDSLSRNNLGLVETMLVRQLTRKHSLELLQTYIKDTPEITGYLIEQSDILWEVTQGSPVMLTLVVELIKQTDQFDLHEIDLDYQDFGEELIARLFNYGDTDSRIFFYLALARQGLTSDLLHHLELGRTKSWTKKDCEAKLSEAATLGLVKSRFDEIFLHDALYELFDQYYLPHNDLSEWYRPIVDYYKSQLLQSGDDWDFKKKIITKLVYYKLQLDPRNAFEEDFMYWDEIAIRGFEMGLDMQLCSELLRFVKSSANKNHLNRLTTYEVERDSTLRWIKRYLIQAKYQNALEISETIVEFCPDAYQLNPNRIYEPRTLLPEEVQQANLLFNLDDAFFWGQLFSLYGETLVYMGELDSVTHTILEKAENLLHQNPTKDQSLPSWLLSRNLGRVYDRLGYLARNNGRYSKARDFYLQAINHYKKAYYERDEKEKKDNIEDELANTQNNLSFVLASLGFYEKAHVEAKDALKTRLQRRQDYPVALSLNTIGRIKVLQGDIDEGIRNCQNAILTFEDIHSNRGIGLAYNALGWGYRQKGLSLISNGIDIEVADINFQQATQYLDKAVAQFSQKVDEPIRLWEGLNELGCVYRDWSNCLRIKDQTQAREKYDNAQKCYDQALEIAKQHDMFFQLSDTYHNLAQIAIDQDDFKLADYRLRQLKGLISNPVSVFSDFEQGDTYWLLSGQYNWCKAVRYARYANQGQLSTEDKERAVKKANSYFEEARNNFNEYSPNSELVNSKNKMMESVLTSLNIPRSTNELKQNEAPVTSTINLPDQSQEIINNETIVEEKNALDKEAFHMLEKHFNLEDLRTLCFLLNVEYDDLLGEGRVAKARELVRLMKRIDQSNSLMTKIQEMRPNM